MPLLRSITRITGMPRWRGDTIRRSYFAIGEKNGHWAWRSRADSLFIAHRVIADRRLSAICRSFHLWTLCRRFSFLRSRSSLEIKRRETVRAACRSDQYSPINDWTKLQVFPIPTLCSCATRHSLSSLFFRENNRSPSAITASWRGIQRLAKTRNELATFKNSSCFRGGNAGKNV